MLEYVLSHQSLEELEASKWTLKLCSAVGHLHACNIVHLDIKLENIFIDANNELKLGDLGLSAFSCHGLKIAKTCGSGVYAAPEVIMSKKIGPYDGRAADIWSVGVCSFVMVRGRFPFNTDLPLKLLGTHATALHIARETGHQRPIHPPLMLNGAQQRSAFSAAHLHVLDACLSLLPTSRPTAHALTTFPWLTAGRAKHAQPTRVPMPVEVGDGFSTPECSPTCSPKNLQTPEISRRHGPSPLTTAANAKHVAHEPHKRPSDTLPPINSRFKRSGKRLKAEAMRVEP